MHNLNHYLQDFEVIEEAAKKEGFDISDERVRGLILSAYARGYQSGFLDEQVDQFGDFYSIAGAYIVGGIQELRKIMPPSADD